MKYELAYYTKENRKKIKHVITSGTLKNIDSFIYNNKIPNILTLYNFINRYDIKKAYDFKIISGDNLREKEILYYDRLKNMYTLNLLEAIYDLYIRDEEFKNKFENVFLSKFINLQDNNSIKELALNIIRFYPNNFNQFYKFFNAYLEPKIDSNSNVNFNYSKYRKLFILYSNHKLELLNSNKELIKKNKVHHNK